MEGENFNTPRGTTEGLLARYRRDNVVGKGNKIDLPSRGKLFYQVSSLRSDYTFKGQRTIRCLFSCIIFTLTATFQSTKQSINKSKNKVCAVFYSLIALYSFQHIKQLEKNPTEISTKIKIKGIVIIEENSKDKFRMESSNLPKNIYD